MSDNVNRFELNFKNKQVRIWFITIIPTIILAILLYIMLPINFHLIPTLLLITAVIIYYGWIFINRKKQKKDNN